MPPDIRQRMRKTFRPARARRTVHAVTGPAYGAPLCDSGLSRRAAAERARTRGFLLEAGTGPAPECRRTMVAFIVRRFLAMFAVLFCVITITFFLIRLAPGGPFTRERKLSPAI